MEADIQQVQKHESDAVEQEIMDFIETDSSEMCQQVLKQAVLTAGGKAAM